VSTIYVNRRLDEPERRRRLFQGDFFLYTDVPEAHALVAWARELAGAAFGDLDPERAQFALDVEEFVRRVAPLKARFTNDERTKTLSQALVRAMGSDPEETYFDLPRLRVVPSDDYLSAGVSYAYKAHRDTWYAHPPCLVNYWVPVYDAVGENVMSMFVAYWNRPVANAGFDYESWVKESRYRAAENIREETRPHPVPLEAIDPSGEIRIAQNAGGMMLFSTCHLHATAPNVSGVTRYSYDLRTVSIRDLRDHRGPRNLDALAHGSTLSDFLRVSDLAPLDPRSAG
jgi:hypothetical protein